MPLTAPDRRYSTAVISLEDPERRRALKALGIGSAGLWLTACVSANSTSVDESLSAPAKAANEVPTQLTA